MSFGSETPGGSPEGIGGNESGIGGDGRGGDLNGLTMNNPAYGLDTGPVGWGGIIKGALQGAPLGLPGMVAGGIMAGGLPSGSQPVGFQTGPNGEMIGVDAQGNPVGNGERGGGEGGTGINNIGGIRTPPSSNPNLSPEDRAYLLNQERYEAAQGYLNPYLESSGNALNQLNIEMGLAPGEGGTAYMNTPGYKENLRETREGVSQSFANAGGAYSGRRFEAAGEASGAVQSKYYDNYMNILNSMASPQTATNMASFGLNQGIAMGSQDIQSQGLDVQLEQIKQQTKNASQAADADRALAWVELVGSFL